MSAFNPFSDTDIARADAALRDLFLAPVKVGDLERIIGSIRWKVDYYGAQVFITIAYADVPRGAVLDSFVRREAQAIGRLHGFPMQRYTAVAEKAAPQDPPPSKPQPDERPYPRIVREARTTGVCYWVETGADDALRIFVFAPTRSAGVMRTTALFINSVPQLGFTAEGVEEYVKDIADMPKP